MEFPLTRCAVMLCAVLSLPGCMSGPSALDLAALQAAPLCCRDFSDFPYQQINLPFSASLSIDQNSPAFNFSSGKSFFAALKIPKLEDIELNIRSNYTFGGTFDPSILILNSNFQPNRLISGNEIEFFAQGAFEPAHKKITLKLSPKKDDDSYVIIFSTESSFQTRSISRSSVQSATTAGPAVIFMSGQPDTGHKVTGTIRITMTGP